MRAVKAWGLMLVAVVGGCASGGNSGDATITGTVKVSGQPLQSGATIVLAGPTGQTTVSDGSGKFAFTKLHDGAYAVIAEVPSTAEGRIVASVTVGKGATGTADLAFTGLGSIKGVATLPGASSSAGISVSVDGASVVGVTDAAGNYVLQGVPVGPHTVTAVVPGQGSASGKVDVAYAKQAMAPALLLGKGGSGSISGTVTLTGGADRSGIVVELVGPSSGVATTDAAGTFAFTGLADGTYVLTAHGVDISPLSRSLQVKIVGGAAVTSVALDFVATGSVSGTVTLNGAPVTNATIVVAGTSLAAYTRLDGSYTLLGVPVGNASLTVLGAGFAPQSLTIAVARGQAATLSFVVLPSHGTASIAGVAALPSGEPAVAAQVKLSTGETTTTDPDGGFLFGNLASGLEAISLVGGSDPAYQETVPNVFATAGANGYYFGNGRVEALAPIELAHGLRVASANCASVEATAPNRAETTLTVTGNTFCGGGLAASQAASESALSFSSGTAVVRVRPDGGTEQLDLPSNGLLDGVEYAPDSKTLVYQAHSYVSGVLHAVTTLVWLDGSRAPLVLNDSSDLRRPVRYVAGGTKLLRFQNLATAYPGTLTLSVVDVASGASVKLDDSSEPYGDGVAYEAGSNVYWVHLDATGSRVRAGMLDGSMVHDIVPVSHGQSSGALILRPSTAGDFVLVQDGDVLGAFGFGSSTPAPVTTGVSLVLPLGTAGAYLVTRYDPQTLTTFVERDSVRVVGGAAQVSAPTPVFSAPAGSSVNSQESADLTLVAYSAAVDGGPQLVVTAATGTPASVTTAPVSGFGFVGDTHTLFFANGQAIGLADIATDGSVGATRSVTGSGLQTPARGRLLAYVDGTGSSVLTDNQLSAPFVLPFPSPTFSFSPDGTRVVIFGAGQSALIATPPAAPVSTGLDVANVIWSSDQNHLVLQEATTGQFTVTDAAFVTHTQLTGVSCVNRFSPSGQRFSFRTLQPSGRYLISIFDIAQGQSLAVLGHSDTLCNGYDLDEWLAGDKLVSSRVNEAREVYKFVAGPYVLSGP